MKFYTLAFLGLSFSNIFGQELIKLPNEFKDNAYNHVKQLSGFGIRNPETKGGIETINYLVKYFRDLNLQPVKDTFQFNCFVAKKINLILANKKIEFQTAWINPFKDSSDYIGEICLFNPDSGYKYVSKELYSNKLIITTENAEIYRLYLCKPRGIIVLNDTVYKGINKNMNKGTLTIQGRTRKYTSYNVYCSLDNHCKKEIIIGAHWDSKNGPGADDNASGVSLVLEIAKYFNAQKNQIPVNLKFILFGAEELGELGSKAYIQKHIIDTASTLYYFNIDCVGDTGEIIVDMRCGVTKSDQKSIFPVNFDEIAYSDYNNQWYNIDAFSEPDESNVPKWLQDILTDVLTSSHHKYIKACDIGSDHRIFSIMGIAATHIGMNGNNVQHCPQDDIRQVNKNSLELAARIVISTLTKTMEKIKNINAR